MKKKVIIIILVILLSIVVFGYYKYIYVPSGQTFRIKYMDLKKETNGSVSIVKEEIRNYSFHTRVTFTKVGDSITYYFDILNDGSIPAKLIRKPIYFGVDNIFKKYIFSKITYADDSDINKGDVINPGERRSFKYQISYYDDSSSLPDKDGIHFESSIYLLYLQDR